MSSKPSESFLIRQATPAEAEVIVKHRRAMFFDMGYRDTAWLDEVAGSFLPWLQCKLESGEYLGWFAVTEEGTIAAGAGLWLQEWMPSRVGRDPRRGYILNVYTEPQYRRGGLARRLMEIILDWCRRQGIAMAALHASDEGRPLYESLRFRATNEMRIDLG